MRRLDGVEMEMSEGRGFCGEYSRGVFPRVEMQGVLVMLRGLGGKKGRKVGGA